MTRNLKSGICRCSGLDAEIAAIPAFVNRTSTVMHILGVTV